MIGVRSGRRTGDALSEERLNTRDTEDHACEQVKVLRPDEEHDGAGWIESAEDGRMSGDVDDPANAVQSEPDEDDRRKEGGDLLRSEWLDHEEDDEDAT